MKYNCLLCKKSIIDYKPDFNHLKIDDLNSADICLDCINKFRKWQQRILTNLFPTKAAKKRLRKEE